jgi:hypothetical protein
MRLDGDRDLSYPFGRRAAIVGGTSGPCVEIPGMRKHDAAIRDAGQP